MPFEPHQSLRQRLLRHLRIIWLAACWTTVRIARITHFGVYKTFIRNEPISRKMLAPTLNGADLKFLVIGGLLLLIIFNILYWTKVIGIHR